MGCGLFIKFCNLWKGVHTYYAVASPPLKLGGLTVWRPCICMYVHVHTCTSDRGFSMHVPHMDGKNFTLFRVCLHRKATNGTTG